VFRKGLTPSTISQDRHYKKRKTSSNDRTSLIFNEIQKGRAERRALFKELPVPQDDPTNDPAISAFFQSAATTVSSFSPLLKARVKLEVMNLISKYEIEHLTQENISFPRNQNLPSTAASTYLQYPELCTVQQHRENYATSDSSNTFPFSPELHGSSY
jgi:hypothetical protein